MVITAMMSGANFRREFEAKLTPLWVRRQIDELEAELVGERARREGVERRDRVLQAQIAKEVAAQQDLKEERDKALDEAAGLKATVEQLTQARLDAEAKQAATQQGLKRQLDKSLDESNTLMATIEDLTRARAEVEEREAETQRDLERERHRALDDTTAHKAMIEELTRARSEAEARAAKTQQELKREGPRCPRCGRPHPLDRLFRNGCARACAQVGAR
jgi:DNA repair exonuclease SbcCD ATPase subunit